MSELKEPVAVAAGGCPEGDDDGDDAGNDAAASLALVSSSSQHGKRNQAALSFGIKTRQSSIVASPTFDNHQKCFQCDMVFGVLNRQHHCRHCGHSFCAKCSGHKTVIAKMGYFTPVRVCAKCFDVLTLENSQADGNHSEEELKPGSKVKVCGLKDFPKYNGQIGIITAESMTFWTITLCNGLNTTIRLRPKNIHILEKAEEAELMHDLQPIQPQLLNHEGKTSKSSSRSNNNSSSGEAPPQYLDRYQAEIDRLSAKLGHAEREKEKVIKQGECKVESVTRSLNSKTTTFKQRLKTYEDKVSSLELALQRKEKEVKDLQSKLLTQKKEQDDLMLTKNDEIKHVSSELDAKESEFEDDLVSREGLRTRIHEMGAEKQKENKKDKTIKTTMQQQQQQPHEHQHHHHHQQQHDHDDHQQQHEQQQQHHHEVEIERLEQDKACLMNEIASLKKLLLDAKQLRIQQIQHLKAEHAKERKTLLMEIDHQEYNLDHLNEYDDDNDDSHRRHLDVVRAESPSSPSSSKDNKKKKKKNKNKKNKKKTKNKKNKKT
mmetsp:Transcript_10145/g.20143  ORF Transcript_10145/g.20143 Transcript_10145/m.20143 type:complete len:546 (+) Transcript_10145:248-1885(+)